MSLKDDKLAAAEDHVLYWGAPSSMFTTLDDISSTAVLTPLPSGRRVKRRHVKRIGTITGWADQVHPGKRHRWREMLHYGERGTGFAECQCGAVGVLSS